MRYSDAIDYLDRKVILGVKPSLERIEAVLRLLGSPHTFYDSIQVTGTNGKTSVAHFIASILRECGLSVGLYTSPHLETVRERIKLNGELISVDSFTRAMERVMPSIERAESGLSESLTYFEVVTALMFSFFRSSGIDVAVLEVGLGGRWDATNVVESAVGVITNVGLDHTRELGPTRERIALEKAGIIKEGASLVTSEADRDILLLLKSECRKKDARMYVFGRDFRLDYLLPYRVPGEPPAQVFSFTGTGGRRYRDLRIPMLGKHQAVNAACAVAAVECFYAVRRPGEELDAESVRRGLASVAVPGRLEVAGSRPLLILDGAHNVQAVEKLASSLPGEFEYGRLTVVVSILDDKDAGGMLRILGNVADRLICTKNMSSRAIPARELERLCRREGLMCDVAESFSEAMELAYNGSGPGDAICVTGSLYTVSEARVFLKKQKSSRETRQDR